MSEWILTLKRQPKKAAVAMEPSFELTLRGDELGMLLGEAMRAALLTIPGDEQSNSPVYVLHQLVEQLLCNAVSFQGGALVVLGQVLSWHENDEDIASTPCDREAMEMALRRALGLRG